MTVDVLILNEELENYKRARKPGKAPEDFTKLTTLAPDATFAIPLFAAYHCALYICPTGLQ